MRPAGHGGRWWAVGLALLACLRASAHQDPDGPDGGVNVDSDARPTVDAGQASFTTTVVGSRRTHGASEVTVDGPTLRGSPRLGATDLLRAVPGLVAAQHSGEGKAQQLFLRGFDAIHGQDVELDVAGLPVNEVSHIHALGYADLNWLIPRAVREVRVTEGSYRGAQGDFAVAGTVRFELGLEEPGVTLAAGYGSYNRFHLFAGVSLAESRDTFAALEYVQGDGFGPQRAFGRLSFLAQGAAEVGPLKVRAVVGSAAGRFDSPGVVRLDAFEAGAAGFFQAFGARQGGSTSRHQLLLGAELPHPTGKTSFEVYGIVSDLTLRNNFTGFFSSPGAGDGLEQVQGSAVVGGRVHHRQHLHLGAQLVSLELGLGGRRDGIRQTQRAYREVDGTPFRRDVDATIGQTAGNGWLEVAWAPEGWRLMLGGRVDVLHFDVLDALAPGTQGGVRRAALGAHWGLKAGVEREVGPVRLFLNYGDGFRSPQARGLADGERAPFVSVRGAEVGAVLAVPRLTARLAGFGSLVERDFFFDHTVGTTVFTGATLRGGVQAQVQALPLDDWRVSANLTWAHARILASGGLLPYFAPLVGRLDTSWSRAFEVLGTALTPRAGLGVTVLGSRPLPFGDWSNPVLLLDARASVRLGAVEVGLDAQNLLDSRWRDGEFVYTSDWAAGGAPSLLPARHFTAGMPLTLLATLEVHL